MGSPGRDRSISLTVDPARAGPMTVFRFFIFGFGQLFEIIQDLTEFFFLVGRNIFHFLEKIFYDSLGAEKSDPVGLWIRAVECSATISFR